MLEEFKLDAEWGYGDYLWVTTKFKSEFATHYEDINKGLGHYNSAIKNTENDADEEAALLAERAKAEAPLKAKPKSYKMAKDVVAPWNTLLPAINSFYGTKRAFKARPKEPDPSFEEAYDSKINEITVPNGAVESAFSAGKQQLDTLRQEYETQAVETARQKVQKLPAPYQKLGFFRDLQNKAGAKNRESALQARKDVATCQTKLAGAETALKTLEGINSAQPSLHPDAWTVLSAMRPTLPGKIGSMEDVAKEEKLIGSVAALETVLEAAKTYTSSRKKVDDLWAKGAIPGLQQKHDEATAAPTDAGDLPNKTKLLAAFLLQPQANYESAVKAAKSRIAAMEKLDPGVTTAPEIENHFKTADAAASTGEFLAARNALAAAENEAKGRGQNVVKQQAVRATDAINDLENDPSIADPARTVLTLLRQKNGKDITVPAIGDETDLGATSRDLEALLRLEELFEPARRYSAALAQAENNRKRQVPGLAPRFKEAVAPLKANGADQVSKELFEAATKRLDAVNQQWVLGRDIDLRQRQVEIDIRTLQTTFKGAKDRDAKADQQTVFGLLADRKKIMADAQELRLEAAAKALSTLEIQVSAAMDGLVGPLKAEARSLTDSDPALKAIMDRIEAATDRSNRDLIAALYQTFGDGLPNMLKEFDKVAGDADHAKAARDLTELCKVLGTRGLRDLGTATCDGDPTKLGRMMHGVVETGLAGASTPGNDQRIANLTTLANSFGTDQNLVTLLKGLAGDDPDKAGERMDALLKKHFGDDVTKLKTPFFDELAKQGDSELPRLIRRAAGFQKEAMPNQAARTVDPATVKGLTCESERVEHFLNRHTEKHCGFKAENIGPGAKSASFWPEGTGVDEVKAHLQKAMNQVGAAPTAGDLAAWPPPNVASFGQKDVNIQVGGKGISVRVGFERVGATIKITQFYPRAGEEVVALSVGDLRAIERALKP